jgi:hypothetical protein
MPNVLLGYEKYLEVFKGSEGYLEGLFYQDMQGI